MVEEPKADADDKTESPILLAEFLEGCPPNSPRLISDLAKRVANRSIPVVHTPDLQLHCESEHCRGTRFFSCRSAPFNVPDRGANGFLEYICRNCNSSPKTFALYVVCAPNLLSGYALKYGEWPVFGPPTPSRLISLVGPDRDAFLKGRQAENLGLGIGAFAYYRRVVENQKNRLLDEVLRVAQKVQAKKEILDTLEAAKKEGQFAKAVEMVKDAIPETLRIDHHNPLTLLHKALSEGLHAKSDEDCLGLASSIRLVLQELAERAGAALKDQAELKSAVSRLVTRQPLK